MSAASRPPTANTAVSSSMPTPLLLARYRQEVVPKLSEQFGYTNRLQVPRVVKVSVNAGVGEGAHDAKFVDQAMQDLALITGQKPVLRRAKKAIAAFKIRVGHPVGCRVTLRGARMYHFLEKLFLIVLPRVRDFRGLPRSFDGRGNFSLGLGEQSVFPEVDLDKMERTFGMDISIVTSADTDEEAEALLVGLGLPLR